MTEEKKAKASILLKNVKGAEFARNIWCATVEQGTVELDILRPEYWAHIAHMLKQGDRIEVECEDLSYFAELYVKHVGKGWAQVTTLRFVNLDIVQEKPQVDPEYTVQYKGKISKWCVIRTKDKTMVHEGAESQSQAVAWMTDHMKAMAA